MKRILICTFFGLIPILDSCIAAEKNDPNGFFGKGDQFAYDPATFAGDEQVITRLAKGDKVMAFVRVSISDFVVRTDVSEPEVFIRLTTKEGAMSPGLECAKLVDFWRNDDAVAALFWGIRGYYYVRASSNPPIVAAPKHRFPVKSLVAGKWMPTLLMSLNSHYVRSLGSESMIDSAGINQDGNVEITYRRDSGVQKDIFSFDQEAIHKNGEKWPKQGDEFGGGRMPFVVEEAFLKAGCLKASAYEVRDFVRRSSSSKEEFIAKVRGEFQDKNAAEEIISAVSKAFEQ